MAPAISMLSTFPNRHGLRRDSLSGSILLTNLFSSDFAFFAKTLPSDLLSTNLILYARLSFCHYHTMEEVSTVLKALQDIARRNQ